MPRNIKADSIKIENSDVRTPRQGKPICQKCLPKLRIMKKTDEGWVCDFCGWEIKNEE